MIRLRRALIGTPLPSAEILEERLSKVQALAIFSSDALSSVAYAVDRWGGEYGAENLPGQGCRFWITFPLLDLNVSEDTAAVK